MARVSAQQVRDALTKDPALFWDTFFMMSVTHIAGRWAKHGPSENGTYYFARNRLRDDIAAAVSVSPTGEISVSVGKSRLPECEATTAEESMRKVDDYLRSKGWLLVP